MTYIALAYLALVAIMGPITFAYYGLDKRRAQRGGRRVPEKTLHRLALFGGWPGALCGQQFFRHKTQKLSFRIVLWLCVAVNLVVIAGIVYLWIRGG